MEKKKLISAWSSIKKAWSELTDNSSLGFSLKAGILFFVGVIVLMIPVFAVFSLVENNKRDVIAPQGVSTEYFEYPSATWDVTPAPTKVSTNPILSVVLSVVGNVFSLVVYSASSIIFIFISLGVHKKDFPSIKNLLTQAFKKAPKFVGMSLLCGLITGRFFASYNSGNYVNHKTYVCSFYSNFGKYEHKGRFKEEWGIDQGI